MHRLFKASSFSTLLFVITACGGGGDAGPSATPGQAQGVYTGSFASQAFPAGKFSTLVLDSDEYWTLYGEEGQGGELTVYGLIQGQGASKSGTFTSSSLKDYFYNGTSYTGSLNATYQAGVSFSGTVTESGQSVSFAGVVPAAGSSTYNYNSTAQLALISGSWSGTNMSGVGSNYTITTAGTFSGVNVSGCGFSGTIAPRASGKNVFNVSLVNNTSAACGNASGLTGRGIAVSSVLANNKRQLIVAVVTNDRAYGSAIFATR